MTVGMLLVGTVTASPVDTNAVGPVDKRILEDEGRVGDLGFAFAGAGAILDEGKSQFDRGLLVEKRLFHADRLAMDLESTIEHVAVIVVTDGDTVLGPRIAVLANLERAPGDGDWRTPLKCWKLAAWKPLWKPP